MGNGLYKKSINNARHLREIISQQKTNVSYHSQNMPLSKIWYALQN